MSKTVVVHDAILRKMNVFPKEIINHLFSFTGIIRERNGVYMNQIDATDSRYIIFKSIPNKKNRFFRSDGMITGFIVDVHFPTVGFIMYRICGIRTKQD